ncbi:HAD family hydrolase [Candidatus Woesearchaeota archaeon]|nr:HAD family hydrolase [Candidatus Woesearchaeota archaeon]
MQISGRNTSGIKAVLLDLDNTIYKYEICNSNALQKVLRDFSKRFKMTYKEAEKIFYIARLQVKKLLEGTAASHSRLLYFKRTIENFTGKTSPELSLYYNKLFWEEYFKFMKLSPAAKEFLAACKNNGIKVAILTDLTAEIQLRKIIHLEISKFVDLVVTSEEAGKDKPNPQVFVSALKLLKYAPEEVIMIGDSDKRDLMSASAMGIKSYSSFEEIPKSFFVR